MKVREAVLQARDEGCTYTETTELLGLGYASVNRILRLQRETNSLEPRPRGGGNVSLIHTPIADLLASPSPFVLENRPYAISSRGAADGGRRGGDFVVGDPRARRRGSKHPDYLM